MKPTFVVFLPFLNFASSIGSEQERKSQSQYNNNRVFVATEYFDVVDKPVLANGHIAYVPFSDSIYMNGLFNGFIRTSSHRARIPNFANIHFESCGSARTADESRCTYKLDIEQALFQTNADFFDGNVAVKHTQYAHRYFDRVIVNTIKLRRKSNTTNETFQLKLNRDWNGWSADLKLGDVITGVIVGRQVVMVAATTHTSENPIYQNQTSKVSILYEKIPDYIEIPSGTLTARFTWLTIVQHTADGMEELFEHLHENHDHLFNTHTIEWSNFWEENAISVNGNDELLKTIQSSMYAIASNLPSLKHFSDNGPFYGVSASGPQADGFQGHSFRDSETWILPAVLIIEPKWSMEILNYRHLVKDAARNHAQNTGYDGLRFPWQSAFTGEEATPKDAFQYSRYAHHITADIGNAVRSVFFATKDLQWMKDYGCDLAMGTARFWASRVTFNESADRYNINGVMGPNKSHTKVNNNAFTNVAAALNLYFGTYASCICHKLNATKYSLKAVWSGIAGKIRLIHDAKLDYNPDYEGYNLSMPASKVNPAMLGYPLQYANIKEATRRNNLQFYGNVSRSSGQAMTWSMLAIGWLNIRMMPAEHLFNRTHAPYVRRPFYVWNKSADVAAPGASNFLSGAGAFLQLIVYGYAGIRIESDSMTIRYPTLPPRTKALKLNGISYMGLRFSLQIASDVYHIELRGDSTKTNVRLYIDDFEKDISVEKQFKLTRKQIVKLLPKETKSMASCRPPWDVIDRHLHSTPHIKSKSIIKS